MNTPPIIPRSIIKPTPRSVPIPNPKNPVGPCGCSTPGSTVTISSSGSAGVGSIGVGSSNPSGNKLGLSTTGSFVSVSTGALQSAGQVS